MPVARASSSLLNGTVAEEVGDAQLGRRVDAPRDVDSPDQSQQLRGGPALALECWGHRGGRLVGLAGRVHGRLLLTCHGPAASSREAVSARQRADYCRLTGARSTLCRQAVARDARAAIGGSTLEFHVLGPLEVVAGERPLAVGGARTRAVLALLLMNANDMVPAERLADQLWPDLAPDRAAANLQVRLSELRRALRSVGESQRLQTRPPGYILRVAPDELDVCGLSSSLPRGAIRLASGDAELAVRILDQSLALWRGPALADIDDAGVREL